MAIRWQWQEEAKLRRLQLVLDKLRQSTEGQDMAKQTDAGEPKYWDMGPPSPCPDIRGMRHAAAVEAMTEWFLANFEDPAERTPWDEGEYVFIWGGPCYAHDELRDAFGGVTSERAIAAAANRIEEEGVIWVPSGSRMRPEPCD